MELLLHYRQNHSAFNSSIPVVLSVITVTYTLACLHTFCTVYVLVYTCLQGPSVGPAHAVSGPSRFDIFFALLTVYSIHYKQIRSTIYCYATILLCTTTRALFPHVCTLFPIVRGQRPARIRTTASTDAKFSDIFIIAAPLRMLLIDIIACFLTISYFKYQIVVCWSTIRQDFHSKFSIQHVLVFSVSVSLRCLQLESYRFRLVKNFVDSMITSKILSSQIILLVRKFR